MWAPNGLMKHIQSSQLLGFEVDAINTVQLSNHTGYKSFGGQKMDDKQLSE